MGVHECVGVWVCISVWVCVGVHECVGIHACASVYACCVCIYLVACIQFFSFFDFYSVNWHSIETSTLRDPSSGVTPSPDLLRSRSPAGACSFFPHCEIFKVCVSGGNLLLPMADN